MKSLYKLTLVTSFLLSSAAISFAQPTVGKSAKVDAVGLYEIVFNPAENAVYVTAAGPRRQNQGKVLKLDPKTLQVTKAIDTGADPAYGLGINTKTQTLYTTNTTVGSVSAIDIRTGKITLIKKEGVKPHFREVVIDETTNTVYASVAEKEGCIWVIDGKKNGLSRIISNTGNVTTGMALDKTANRMFVTNMSDHKVAVIDLKTDKIVEQFEAGGENPTNVVLDSKTNRLFVANQKTGDITVLDSKTGKLLKSVKTGEGALGVNFNPGNKRIYVANRGAGTVTVIDSTSYAVLANLQTGSHPNTVAIDTRSNAVYVTNKAKRVAEGETDAAGDTVTLIVP